MKQIVFFYLIIRMFKISNSLIFYISNTLILIKENLNLHTNSIILSVYIHIIYLDFTKIGIY